MPKKKRMPKVKQDKSFSSRFPDVFPRSGKAVAFGKKKVIRKGPKARKRTPHKKVVK